VCPRSLLNVVKPRPLIQRNKWVPSAIFKSLVSGPLWLGSINLEGNAPTSRIIMTDQRRRSACMR